MFKDQGVVYLNDAFKYINGVNAFSEYLDFNMRGFRQRGDSVKYNGMTQSRYGFFHKVRLNNIERIEVIKGPASALYGISQPGGIVNIITKQPKFESEGALSLEVGSFDKKAIDIYSTGNFENNDNLLYLLQSTLSNSKGFRKNEKFDSKFFSGALTYLLDDDSDLTLSGEYLKDHTYGQRNRGIPFVPGTGKLAKVSKDYTANEPSDFISIDTYAYQALYNKPINDDFSLKATVGFVTNDRRQKYHEPRGLNKDGRTMKREFRDQIRQEDQLVFNIDANYQLISDNINHNILFGAEAYKQNFKYLYGGAKDSSKKGPVKDIDIFNPVYEAEDQPHWMSYNLVKYFRNTKSTRSTSAVYLQNQMNSESPFGDTNILAGMRYNTFEDKDKNTKKSFSDSKLTFKVGATLEPMQDQTFYASYSQGFIPANPFYQFDKKTYGGPFKPEQSYSIEGGLKSSLLENKLNATVSLYHIVRTDILLRAPTKAMPRRMSQVGEVTSQGLEVDLTGRINDNLSIVAGAAHNLKAEVTKQSPNEKVWVKGKAMPNNPKNTFNASVNYLINIDNNSAVNLFFR